MDWYPWGEEAFEKARREDKPIFLSVGKLSVGVAVRGVHQSAGWCQRKGSMCSQDVLQQPQHQPPLHLQFVRTLGKQVRLPALPAARRLLHVPLVPCDGARVV